MTQQTLCWECQRSTGCNLCDWAKKFKPVKGWNAIRRDIKISRTSEDFRGAESYLVLECPEFLKEVG